MVTRFVGVGIINGNPPNAKSLKRKILLKNLLISLGTGFVSTLLSPEMRVVYETANKPPYAPPAWVFGPVWVILYILMGIAAYRVFISGSERPEVKDALFFYYAQLAVNFMWPILFFRYALAGTAFLDIIFLIVLVLITTVKFFKIDRTAGWLMLPYLVWLIYAAFLNYSFL